MPPKLQSKSTVHGAPTFPTMQTPGAGWYSPQRNLAEYTFLFVLWASAWPVPRLNTAMSVTGIASAEATRLKELILVSFCRLPSEPAEFPFFYGQARAVRGTPIDSAPSEPPSGAQSFSARIK